ncbi:MAG: DNA-3-methyladenine glycosylase [Bacteroidales bacterium]|nr:DNA-3-methyladenine glycosylase [Bacteroidales bacterium]
MTSLIPDRSFYEGNDVVLIARELIGKVLCTRINGVLTSGIITETEAYAGVTDKASHAYGDRRTPRTEIMYSRGGTAYVYLCYGIHSLFNVVTSVEGNPHAVLIRAIDPLDGKEVMAERINAVKLKPIHSIGPGKVSKLLGIHYNMTGMDMLQDIKDTKEDSRIWIEDRGINIDSSQIQIGSRIGVEYAGEDAHLPYRFFSHSRVRI